MNTIAESGKLSGYKVTNIDGKIVMPSELTEYVISPNHNHYPERPPIDI